MRKWIWSAVDVLAVGVVLFWVAGSLHAPWYVGFAIGWVLAAFAGLLVRDEWRH